MSDTIWQLVEKWDKRDPYSLGKDELERCKRELKQALAAAPALPEGRVRQECVEAGVDCIGGINYFELTKRLNALLAQPAPRHKLINKDHFPALCPACRPAEPAPDSPDNYCYHGVPIASDECELCPPGTHKVLDSAGSNLRVVHAGREHAASPEQPTPPQNVPETWAGPPEPDEIEIMNARLGPPEGASCSHRAHRPCCTKPSRVVGQSPAPAAKEWTGDTDLDDHFRRTGLLSDKSTSAISIGVLVDVLLNAEEWLRAHDFNDLAIKIYGKSLAKLIISAQQEATKVAERMFATVRADRDMDWWRAVVLVDNVAPTPEAAKAWLAQLSKHEQTEAMSSLSPDILYLNGKATNHIWLMEDGEEPHVIGIRLDSGDSGTVYVTREQAKELAEQLANFVKPNLPGLKKELDEPPDCEEHYDCRACSDHTDWWVTKQIAEAEARGIEMAAQTAEAQRLGTGPQGVAYAIRALKETRLPKLAKE